MLQRQIVAEGGYGENNHGIYYGMGESELEGGARRKAKGAFPVSAKKGLCQFRLFQAQHPGMSRAEMSAKWAKHKARGGSLLGGGASGGECATCGGAGLSGGCYECGGTCGGAREFGDNVDGRCVYREFKRDHPGMTQTALAEGWRGAKFANELYNLPTPVMEGSALRTPKLRQARSILKKASASQKLSAVCGGFIGERKEFAKIRNTHKKASRAELSRLYEKARQAYHKRMTGRRAPHLKMRDIGGKPIHELIEKCANKVARGEIPSQKSVTNIAKKAGFTKEMYNNLMGRLDEAIARQRSPAAAAAVAEVAGDVAETCGEEIKQQEKSTKKGSGIYGGADPTACEMAKAHAAEVLMNEPAARSNPEAAAEVIRAANMSAPMMECGALDTFAGQACQERNRRLARLQSSSGAAFEDEFDSGSGMSGGAKRMTAAQKKSFIRKCMRSKE